jgi:very-short-patch-repair endonuclease
MKQEAEANGEVRLETKWEDLSRDERFKLKQLKAAQMLKKPTQGEMALHRAVCRFLPAAKWKRQRLLFGYIADGYSKRLKIVVEADGGYHQAADRVEYDRKRDAAIEKRGVKVLRFTNETCLQNPRAIAEALAENAVTGFETLKGQIARLKAALEDPKWNGKKMPVQAKEVQAPPPSKVTEAEVYLRSFVGARRRVVMEKVLKLVSESGSEFAEMAKMALKWTGQIPKEAKPKQPKKVQPFGKVKLTDAQHERMKEAILSIG